MVSRAPNPADAAIIDIHLPDLSGLILTQRLRTLWALCESGPDCPVNNLRLAGSPHYLLTRYYEERDED